MTESESEILQNAEAGRQTEQGRYYTTVQINKLAEIDFFLDVLLCRIERSPLRDNTAVILTTDHGVNLPTDRDVEGWAKKHLCDERLHVPLLLRCPWREETFGKVYHGFVESCIDLLPSVAEMTGIDAWHSSYSRSFLPTPDGHFRGKDYAITEMIFRGDYKCRIIDAAYEYVRSFNWTNGASDEELRDAKSRLPVPAGSPLWASETERFRKIPRDLRLFQPGDNVDEYC